MKLEEELLKLIERQKGEENGVVQNPFVRVIKGKDWVSKPLLVPNGSRKKKNHSR